jgi:hypothetical protein
MKGLVVIPAAVVFIAAFPAGIFAQPDIGGTPIHTEQDYFSYTEGVSDWGLTVYSYVYGSASSLPDMGISLFPDEMLFVYLLDGDDATTDSVEYFSVFNPDDMPVVDVGYESDIIPMGYNAGKYQNPVNYQYSGFTQTISYNFTGGYMFDIQPDEWSLVYYISVCDTWAPATGTVAAGGSDVHDVPAPAPGPPCIVDFQHFARFADNWLQVDCNDMNNWCDGADLSYSGDVNSLDLRLFADEWLDYCPVPWPL